MDKQAGKKPILEGSEKKPLSMPRPAPKPTGGKKKKGYPSSKDKE